MKLKYDTKLFSVLFFIFVVTTYCKYNINKQQTLIATPTVLTTSPEQITYQMVAENIIQPKCLICHSLAGGNKGQINLETYQSVVALAPLIRSDIVGKLMPPASSGLSLSDAEIIFITNWIDAGSYQYGYNQTPTPTPTPTTTFTTVKSQVLTPSCLGCHAAATGNKGGINLETYQNVIKYKSNVQSTIQSNSMPPGGTLTATQKSLILNWLNAGALQ